MALLQNYWNRIVEFFRERRSRNELVRNFNEDARKAFVNGVMPLRLEASVSRGNRKYQHPYSNILLGTGFRIKAESLNGYVLSREDKINIGGVILSNPDLVRNLVSLGWDTLEVHSGSTGCQWQLRSFAMLGQGQ